MGTLGAVRFSTMHCIHCAKDLLPSFHPQSVSIFFRHPCVPSHRLLGLGHPTFAIHSRIQSPRKAHWRERGVRQCLSLFPPAPPFEREEKVPRAGSIHSVPLYSVLAGRGAVRFSTMHCIHCAKDLLPSFHPQSVSIFFRHPCVPSHRLLGLGHPTFAIHSRIQSPRKAHWRERGVRQCLSLFPPAPPFEREEKVPRAGSIHSVPLYSVLAGRGGGACIHCGTSLHKKTPNR